MNYKIIDGEKVYGYRWIILALMGLACIVVNGSTLVFAGMAGILLNPTGPWAFDAQQFMMLTSCSYLTGFLFCMVTGTMADRMGITDILTAAGAEIIPDTCPDQPCWHYLKGKVGITESPKCAYYPRRRGINFMIRDLDTCIEAALTGEVK